MDSFPGKSLSQPQITQLTTLLTITACSLSPGAKAFAIALGQTSWQQKPIVPDGNQFAENKMHVQFMRASGIGFCLEKFWTSSQEVAVNDWIWSTVEQKSRTQGKLQPWEIRIRCPSTMEKTKRKITKGSVKLDVSSHWSLVVAIFFVASRTVSQDYTAMAGLFMFFLFV